MKMKKIYARYLQVKQGLLAPDFIRFVIAGVLSVLIEYAVLITFVEKIHLNVLFSNSVSFVSATTFNYIISRLWVFGKSNKRIRHELFLFFATGCVGLVINQSIMWVLVDRYLLNYKIAKLFAIIVVVFWNFLTKKFLVFSDNTKKVAC